MNSAYFIEQWRFLEGRIENCDKECIVIYHLKSICHEQIKGRREEDLAYWSSQSREVANP